MAVKTILACLTDRETADAVLGCAVPLARAHGAHLICLHTVEALLVYPGIAMHVPDAVFASFNDSQKQEADAIKAIFAKHTDPEDFASEWRLLRTESATAAERLIESSRAADLVIMSRENPDNGRFDQGHIQIRVIRESGRPVIIVPPSYDGPMVGKNIVLGWSDTREAARAAHDLLSLTADGAEISLVRVDAPNADELSDFDAIDLAAMYARHGLRAQTVHRSRNGTDIASVLLKFAFEQGADLVATGAFGHSRVYDFVIGAVTYKLLSDAKVPVLFST